MLERFVRMIACASLPLLAAPLAAQSGTLRGTVADSAGAGLANASVAVDGTGLRATTRPGGEASAPEALGDQHQVERDDERVQQDVAEGYVSAEAAREQYGVVLDATTLAINATATAARRQQMRDGK